MNIVCQFMTKNPVHLPMPAYQGHRFKSLTDQDYLKMRLRTGRNIVVATFIDDFQSAANQLPRQVSVLFFPESFFPGSTCRANPFQSIYKHRPNRRPGDYRQTPDT